MDKFTAKMTKTRFARVCVEVGVNFEYPASIPVDLATRIGSVNAEYKWKAKACNGCSTFGHTSASCPKDQKVNTQEKVRKWQPVPNNNLQQEKEDAPEVSNLPCDERLLQPVAVAQIGSSPGESEPTCLNQKEAKQRGNRFDILASLEDEKNIANETATVKRAAANPEKNTPVGQMSQLEVINFGEQLREVREYSNQMDSGIMMEKTNSFVGKVGDCLEICDVVLNSLQSSVVETSKQTVEGVLNVASDSLTKDADMGIIGTEASIVDKGGTKFDPSNPNTWTEAMREADQNISMVMAE